jgi:hypothetical protein
MTARNLISRVLIFIGVGAMVVGIVDPIEGSFVILPGSGLVAFGAFLGRSRRRWRLFWAFVLVSLGVGAMFVMSEIGGVGGNSGHSNWWMLTALPYPVGWIMSLVTIIPALIEADE